MLSSSSSIRKTALNYFCKPQDTHIPVLVQIVEEVV